MLTPICCATSSRRRLLAVALTSFLLPLAVTAPSTVLPDVGRSLHATPVSTQWMVNGYAVAGACGLGFRAAESRNPSAHRLDLPGMALFSAALSGLAVAFVQAPRDGWTSLATLVCGSVLIAIGCLLLLRIGADAGASGLVPGLLVFGLGVGPGTDRWPPRGRGRRRFAAHRRPRPRRHRHHRRGGDLPGPAPGVRRGVRRILRACTSTR